MRVSINIIHFEVFKHQEKVQATAKVDRTGPVMMESTFVVASIFLWPKY